MIYCIVELYCIYLSSVGIYCIYLVCVSSVSGPFMFAVVFNASNILKKERLFPYNHFICEKSLYPLILFSRYQRQLVSKLLNFLVGILWTSFQAANFLENATVSDILPKAFIFHWRSMVHKEAWLISAKQDLFLYQTHSGTLSLLPVFFISFLELHSTLDFPFFFLMALSLWPLTWHLDSGWNEVACICISFGIYSPVLLIDALRKHH